MDETNNEIPGGNDLLRSPGDPPNPIVTDIDVSPPRGTPFPIVGIGASAGGLEAFTQLLAALPGDTGMAFVLIQHLDPKQVSHLPELLDNGTPMPVVIVEDALQVQPNHVYVIPPNATIVLEHGHLRLVERLPGLHLPIDIFFRSLAHEQGGRAIGVVLSGNASDGSAGLKAIKAECGLTFAQDESSAKYSGMPRSAAGTGAVDYILPPAEIARELTHLGRHPYLIPRLPSNAHEEVLPDGDGDLKRIFTLLEGTSKVDFSHYKRNTVRRRIGRRMMVNRTPDLASYAQLLERRQEEIVALYRDLLIGVTGFFREPAAFETLTRVLREELINGQTRESIRVWVPGCATGEEVYSLAIVLQELLYELQLTLPLQIFGTDISDIALGRARAGIYSEIVTHDVSDERLHRHFNKSDGSYQVDKRLRQSCIFARQDLTKDPPFANMDLVSCRNVLIYLDSILQQRVLPIFHYSLKPSGLLMLGSAETIAAAPDLFRVVDNRFKLFGRRETAVRLTLGLPMPERIADGRLAPAARQAGVPDLQRRVDRLIHARYTPNGVVIDSDLRILQFRGRTSQYLEPSWGDATLHLLHMVRAPLVPALRRGVQAATNRKTTVREKSVMFEGENQRRAIDIEITPVPSEGHPDGCFLVVFTEVQVAPAAAPAERTGHSETSDVEQELRRLERELTELREYGRSLSEEHEANSEELQSANEEIRSANEELQSTNEELSTTKEELQSTNEELITLNEELETRNQELTSANSDLKNLLTAVNIPIIMVDGDLRVRRFTAAAEKLLDLAPVDIGRPVRHLHGYIDFPELEHAARKVLETLHVFQRELQDDKGSWHSVSIRPYRTIDNQINGVVISFMNITPLKQVLQIAEESRDHAESMLNTVRQPLVVLDADLRVLRVTSAFCDTFRVSREETIGRHLYDLGNGQWNRPRLRELLGNALFRDTAFQDFEVDHDFPHVGRRTMRLNARRISGPPDRSKTVLLSIEDVTERREQAEIQYRRLFETAKDGILIFDAETTTIVDVNHHMLDMLGYSREEVIGRKVSEIPAFHATGELQHLVEQTRVKDIVRYNDVAIISRNGTPVEIELIANPYTVGGQKVVQANVRDVTDRKRTETALRETEERFRLYVESVQAYALFQMDLEHRIVVWNSGAQRLLGYTAEEVLGQLGEIVYTPEDRAAGEPQFEIAQARRLGRVEDERWHIRKDGSRFFASGVLTVVRDAGRRHVGYAKIMRDVTAQKQVEEKLRTSVQEKDVLLKEIHHRVKNNLQVISSLLSLQSDQLADPEAAAALADMRSRVLSIASIHELLYNSADLSQIDFGAYMRRLSKGLMVMQNIDGDQVRLVTHAPSVKLELGQAVPTALLVNELLTNSLKHAFPSGRPGTVTVSLDSDEQEFRLQVTDDGVGLPEGTDLSRSTSMGLQLVFLLAEQLHGTVEIQRNNGTQFLIVFPRPNAVQGQSPR